MTKLLIDVGNTRLKLATLNGNELVFLQAIETRAPADCQATLASSIEALELKLGLKIESCIGVSVASAATNAAIEKAIAPLPVQWVQAQHQAANVVNSYPDPTQLGPDRWVAMIGLTRHFGQPHPPVILATFGTATTIDTLSPDHEFKGGLIMPGVAMMHASLANGTARLPNTPGSVEDFPTNTASAIASGIVRAQVGAVMQQVELAHGLFGILPVLCTSGGAYGQVEQALTQALNRTFQGASPKPLPNIVLDGLAMLATSNG